MKWELTCRYATGETLGTVMYDISDSTCKAAIATLWESVSLGIVAFPMTLKVAENPLSDALVVVVRSGGRGAAREADLRLRLREGDSSDSSFAPLS